jgi:hypothetical protein
VFNSHFLSTICGLPESSTDIYCIARDELGRHIWKNKLNYYREAVIYHEPAPFCPVTPSNIPVPLTLEDVQEELFANITEEEREAHQEVLK